MRKREKNEKKRTAPAGTKAAEDYVAIRAAKARLGLNGDAGLIGLSMSDTELLAKVCEKFAYHWGVALWNHHLFQIRGLGKEVHKRLLVAGYITKDSPYVPDEDEEVEEDEEEETF